MPLDALEPTGKTTKCYFSIDIGTRPLDWFSELSSRESISLYSPQ